MGARHAQKLWVCAEEPNQFNRMIVGKIEVIAGFHDGRPESGECESYPIQGSPLFIWKQRCPYDRDACRQLEEVQYRCNPLWIMGFPWIARATNRKAGRKTRSSSSPWFVPAKCTECGEELWKGSLLRLEGEKALCTGCADLDRLEFLPSGDAAVTRRASKYSKLRAVVVRWSRTRKRYERQGILVEPKRFAVRNRNHSRTRN